MRDFAIKNNPIIINMIPTEIIIIFPFFFPKYSSVDFNGKAPLPIALTLNIFINKFGNERIIIPHIMLMAPAIISDSTILEY